MKNPNAVNEYPIQYNVERVELHAHMELAYMSYAMAVIVDRALPDVRDGLLPVHRRIIYSMFNKGITYDKQFAKCSEPVSETMKIHHHGDSSTYGSLTLLTDRNETLLHPLLEGDGSFGKAYSTDNPSHMRYTFCRLSKFSEEMFAGIKQNAVKFIGEDGHFQPVVLPTTYPAILVKPNNAIAVGEACCFGSFPLSEVCNVTVAYIDDSNIDIIDYLTPDFPTGAQLIYNKAQLSNIYATGKGSVKLRSKYTYNEEEGIIEIYEIPYSTTAQKIIADVIDKMPKFKEILDVRDETGFNKKKGVEELKITIDVKKNTNVEILMGKLFMETPLESSFSFNMNCLVNNRPQVLGIKPMLDEWLKFRRECIINTMNYTIESKNKSLHLLLGLEKTLLDIEETIRIIRFSPKNEMMQKLMDFFKIDEEQAQYIAKMELRKISEDYIVDQIKDIMELKEEVEKLKENSQDIQYINGLIKEDLTRIASTYGRERCTEIIHVDNVVSISKKHMIEDYTATSILTKLMYYKKCRRFAEADKQRIRDGDEVLSMIQCSNTGKVIFISNLGNAYPVNLDDMDEKTSSAMGDFLPSILSLDTDEVIIGMLATDNYKGYAFIMYENGKLAKIPLKSYETKTNRSKLANCLSHENGEVIMIAQSAGDVELQMVDSFGKIKTINTEKINSKTTRNTMGVTVWRSEKEGFKIVSANILK